MPDLTRRHVLLSAASVAAVAAMPAASAIAAVEQAPELTTYPPFDVDRFIAFCVTETERLHPGSNPRARFHD